MAFLCNDDININSLQEKMHIDALAISSNSKHQC